MRLESLFEHLDQAIHAFGADLHLKLGGLDLGRFYVVGDATNTLDPLVREAVLSNGRGKYVSAPFPYMVRDEGIGGRAPCVPFKEAVEKRGLFSEVRSLSFGNIGETEVAYGCTHSAEEREVGESDLK